MRLACVVEYDGAGFRGWQEQRGGRTVQAAVEHALGSVADHGIDAVAAGRTDAGVHATGQVVHFDTPAQRPPHAWVMGTNSHLPRDVAVRWAGPVDDSFHARYSATSRVYRYLVAEGRDRPALWRDRVCWIPHALDESAMRGGAAHLLGEHDFTAFRGAECQSRSPVRRVEGVDVVRHGRVIALTVEGNAFLHNMVRIFAGTLIVVGRGHRPPEWVAEVLAGRDRRRAGVTAAAQGLYFLGAAYPPAFGVPTPRIGETPLPGG